MVRQSDKIYMLVATGTRLALSLATFAVIVRFLGPANFGVYAASIAVASVAAAVTDFGLATSSLRAASIERERSSAIIGDALALKLALVVLAMALGAGGALLLVEGEGGRVFLLLLVGMLAYSLADLAMVAARVNRVFALEARIVVVTGIAMFTFVGATAALTGSLLAVASAFAATRLGYLVATLLSLRAFLEPVSRFRRSLAQLAATARSATAYAVDSILTMVSGQIDVLVFATLLTLAELGTYQAGARLTQVIVPFAVMLSSVYLPALSASLAGVDPDREFRALSGRLTLEFLVLSVIGALAFLIGGPIVTQYIYGPEFSALDALWPAFAIYALFRFAAAGFGIQLVALGHIRTRIVSQALSMAVFVLVAFAWLPDAGFVATSTIMATMGLSAFVVLGISLARTERKHPAVLLSLVATPAAAAIVAALS